MVLSLVDEMYTLRRRLAALARALAETPAEVRTTVVTRCQSPASGRRDQYRRSTNSIRPDRRVEQLPAIGFRRELPESAMNWINAKFSMTFIGCGKSIYLFNDSQLLATSETKSRAVAALLLQCSSA